MRYLILIPLSICSALFCSQSPLLPSLPRRLHVAVEDGNIEQIGSLIALNVDPNVRFFNRTVLEVAVCYKRPAVIEYLIQKGAQLSDDIIMRLLRTGNEHYTIDDVITSLNILLMEGARPLETEIVPYGYLLPVMIAHGNIQTAHARVLELMCRYAKKKMF